MHNYGLAIDIVLIVDKDGNGTYESASWDVKADFDGDRKSDWMEVVTIFKQHGWTWGGDWKFYDAPHFEKSFGYSVRQLLDLHNKKKVDANNYVLI
jgi:peptidoglycan L-alanyl-D-glutamate endopeptidase CwlK